MVAIIDYNAGNIKSVEKAFRFLGEDAVITRDFKAILSAERVVLPGVGSFGSCMDHLKSFGLVEVIREVCASGKPFLGICLGHQMLFSGSEEDGGVEGLDIFKGQVRLFDKTLGIKVPQIGWNNLDITPGARLFEGLKDPYVYFVHSYYVKADDEDVVSARTEYGVTFDSSVEGGNIFGCQFHPEKSSKVGLSILKNFCEIEEIKS